MFINESITADEKYIMDQYKTKLATNKGFFVLEIWSDESVDDNVDKCIKFIEERLNEN